MTKLYKFYWDCGRMGYLEGIFAEDEDYVKSAIGIKVYFGEVLGKHSEIFGCLKESDLNVLTDDQGFIQKAEEYGLIPSGHNPFDYIDSEKLKEYIAEKEI